MAPIADSQFGFQGPPAGMFHYPDIQAYYETTIWPELLRARERWARQHLEGFASRPVQSPLMGMLGHARRNLNNYELQRDVFGFGHGPFDRMSRGLAPMDEDFKDFRYPLRDQL